MMLLFMVKSFRFIVDSIALNGGHGVTALPLLFTLRSALSKSLIFVTKSRDFESNDLHFESAVRDFIMVSGIQGWFTEISGWFMEIQSSSFMILFAFST